MQERRRHVKDGRPENPCKPYGNPGRNEEPQKRAVGDSADEDAGRFVESGCACKRLGGPRTGGKTRTSHKSALRRRKEAGCKTKPCEQEPLRVLFAIRRWLCRGWATGQGCEWT